MANDSIGAWNETALTDWAGMTDGTQAPVYPDVAYGAPDEQPTNPAGNGFGTFFTGALDKALNYAIAKDHATWGVTSQGVPLNQQPRIYAQQQKNNQLLLWLGVGVVAFLVIKS